MIFQVFRTHTSDYLGHDFIEREEKSLKVFANLKYCKSIDQIDSQKPLILIGSSQSNYENFSPLKYKEIKLVIHANSGFDNISLDWCKSLNAPIIVCHEIRQYAVSEYVLSCLLEHYAQIPKRSSWDRSWKRKLISDQKILILGFGHIGKTVYQALLPFSQHIVVSDPFKGWNANTDDEFDIIINCTSLNPTTKNFIDTHFLKKLRRDGVFINPARGQSVVENDLLDFLNTHPQATAYLDVFAQEPKDFSVLKKMTNLIPTSHQAGVFEHISQTVLDTESVILKNFFELASEDFFHMYQSEILKNRIINYEDEDFFI